MLSIVSFRPKNAPARAFAHHFNVNLIAIFLKFPAFPVPRFLLVDLFIPRRHIHLSGRHHLRHADFHCQTSLMTNYTSVTTECAVLQDFEL